MNEELRYLSALVDSPEGLAIIGGIRQRIHALQYQHLTPWRIEIGREMASKMGNPIKLYGLPVEVVPLDDYFRVAYTEWTQDHVPTRTCFASARRTEGVEEGDNATDG